MTRDDRDRIWRAGAIENAAAPDELESDGTSDGVPDPGDAPFTEEERGLIARYQAALHGMQTGVAYAAGWDHTQFESKHLRVGVNSALVERSALASLLIETGVIERAAYLRALAETMEAERDRYQAEVREHYGHDGIHLG